MRIVFFGTPPFAAHILKYLFRHDVNIVGIVTRTDKPRGRSLQPQPSAVKAMACELAPEIPLYQPEKASADSFLKTLKSLKPDLCLIVAYGEIVKQKLLDLPKKGCINVHPSLLPKYRGAAPIQRAIINGEAETGVTIMEMIMKLDAGASIEVMKTKISEEINAGELEERLADLSCGLLMKVLEQFESGSVKKVPQDENDVTYAHKIGTDTCRIDWLKRSEEVHNLIRGVAPKPGAWCLVGKKRMKILKARVNHQYSGKPGQTADFSEKGWVVNCGDGAIDLLEIQMEGKKPTHIEDFVRGNSSINLLH